MSEQGQVMPSAGEPLAKDVVPVTLPDGKTIQAKPGSPFADLLEHLPKNRAKAIVAAKVGQTIVDLNSLVPGDGQAMRLIDAAEDDGLYVIRHSCAHVMAEAICRLFPETQLVYGPPVEDGFYYDIDLDRPITPDDFPMIEAEMRRIIADDRPFTCVEMDRQAGLERLRQEGSRYKLDNAVRADGDTLSWYVTGPAGGVSFEDLCRGPHLPSTGRVPVFKLMQVSGAYYRGDQREKQLQRVYGTAWASKKDLEAYLRRLEEAKKRDHRKIGQELGLFTISQQVGAGMVLWLPKGAIVRYQLEEFIRQELLKRGYEMVYSPQIGRLSLYRTSGHYPYYREAQFPPLYMTDRAWLLGRLFEATLDCRDATAMGEHVLRFLAIAHELVPELEDDLRKAIYPGGPGESHCTPERIRKVVERLQGEEDGYLLRPMNCPHHIQIYKAQPRSYRDLPLRLAEFGMVYRYEQSGELRGMIRVRGFTQDDAHQFCAPDQLGQELRTTAELTRFFLQTLGLDNYRVRLGFRDESGEKWVGSPESWQRAEQNILEAAQVLGVDYAVERGEAAFYGPKIDFVIKDCIGREWQLGTVQVDYNLPERFDLTYIGADNRQHRPIMIHRAPLGSMERFVGILIEHFAGAFPTWLSPVQVVVATVSEKSDEYARRIYEVCREAGLRAELDISSDKIGAKIRKATLAKVPYVLVIGEQEVADRTVNVRHRTRGQQGSFHPEQFLAAVLEEIQKRALT